jgi:hypothetical protein
VKLQLGVGIVILKSLFQASGHVRGLYFRGLLHGAMQQPHPVLAQGENIELPVLLEKTNQRQQVEMIGEADKFLG